MGNPLIEYNKRQNKKIQTRSNIRKTRKKKKQEKEIKAGVEEEGRAKESHKQFRALPAPTVEVAFSFPEMVETK